MYDDGALSLFSYSLLLDQPIKIIPYLCLFPRHSNKSDTHTRRHLPSTRGTYTNIPTTPKYTFSRNALFLAISKAIFSKATKSSNRFQSHLSYHHRPFHSHSYHHYHPHHYRRLSTFSILEIQQHYYMQLYTALQYIVISLDVPLYHIREEIMIILKGINMVYFSIDNVLI